MKYKYLLFDADRTLLDFNASMRKAIEYVLKKYGFPVNEEVISFYNSLNNSLWKQLEDGEITREDLVNNRFPVLCAMYQVPYPGKGKMEADYFSVLANGTDLMPGAKEILEKYKDRYGIIIVTNGFSFVQRNRLEKTGLMPLIKDLFVSEEVGYEKPDAAFFTPLFEKYADAERSEFLLIGDSMEADIQSAANIGVDSVLVGDAGPENYDFAPTYVVSDLYGLDRILD